MVFLYKRSLQAAKQRKVLTFHWRGGYLTREVLKELPNRFHSHIPIIAVSANAFDEDMEASYEAGMNGHLAKPIIESELLKTLGEIWFDNFFMID